MTATEMEVDTTLFEDLVADLDTPYVVKILDDDVNTMDYVVAVFMKHFKLDEETATLRMLEVHQDGFSVLDSGTEEEMLAHHEAMRHYKLRSCVEKAS